MAGERFHSGRTGFAYDHAGDTSIGKSTSKVSFFGVTGSTRAAAMTAATNLTVAVTYDANAQNTIINLRTRLNEMETKLKSYGLLT